MDTTAAVSHDNSPPRQLTPIFEPCGWTRRQPKMRNWRGPAPPEQAIWSGLRILSRPDGP